MPDTNMQDDTVSSNAVTATVLLTHGGLSAHLSTGEILQNPDPVALADMLLAAGLTAQSVRMPDWRVGDRSPLAGQKIALMLRMHRAR